MYLSRIELDLQWDKTRHAVASPQVLHAAVENCFSDNDGKARKLWRLDSLRGKRYLLLLSPEKPDFSYFAEQFCPGGVCGETKGYGALLARVQNGQRWRFRLRGNAAHSVSAAQGERGKVYAHVTAKHQRQWLMKKAGDNGFALEAHMFDVTKTDQIQFWRDRGNPPVTLGVAEFEGTLEVADAALFRRALTQGIGRAKAYGCGLLTIAGCENR